MSEALERRVKELERQVQALTDASQQAADFTRTEIMRVSNEMQDLRWQVNYLLAGLESLVRNAARGDLQDRP